MTRRPRRGVALFAALSLTMIVGLLIAGSIATTRAIQRSARVERTDALLDMDADDALFAVFGDLHRLGLDDTGLGKRVSVTLPAANANAMGSVSVTRLPGNVLWLVSDVAGIGADEGHRRVGLVARFPSILPTVGGAIVARGDIELANDVSITLDTSTEPDCDDRLGAVVMAAPTANVAFSDSSALVRSGGTGDSAAYLLTASQLAALGHTGRFVHVLGDTTIAGGAFDGILIVDGALTISGPFTATGLLVARGPIVATGPLAITGSVRSFADPGIGKLAIKFSGAAIRYSRCAVERVLRRSLDAHVVTQRSWAEIF
jgi:hypothetical protein